MTEYYKNLYDINFFSGDEYLNTIDNISVKSKIPGKVNWETWNSQNVMAKQAETLFFEAVDLSDITRLKNIRDIFPKEYYILTLLISEHAYRSDNENLLIKCYEILKDSSYNQIRLRAEKLILSFKALKLIVNKMNYKKNNSQNQLLDLQQHALSFLMKKLGIHYNLNDFKVELPVLKDWKSRNMNFDDPSRLEEFYKTTDSYVLELIAANNQVETLFNYSIAIRKLLELGITNIYDYAGGIGTFSILSVLNGINVTFSELDSITGDYAIQRINDSGLAIKTEILEYDKPDFLDNLQCIVCTEVLEHIYEPEELIKYFYSKLEQNGILVVSESFDYIEKFCTHLPNHKGKGGINFINFMNMIGFKQVVLNYNIHPIIFIKQ
jgi:2-polyprenyl-3-methyl-5-hydroxy-6-metoxy-1,4-benzoquinol methylase